MYKDQFLHTITLKCYKISLRIYHIIVVQVNYTVLTISPLGYNFHMQRLVMKMRIYKYGACTSVGETEIYFAEVASCNISQQFLTT